MKLEDIDQNKFPRLWTPNESGEYFDISDYKEFSYDKTKSRGKITHNLDQIIDKLKEIRNNFKSDDIVVYYEDHSGCYYESDTPSHKFVLARPETDKEYCIRVAGLIKTQNMAEEYQKRQYEELKKRFEGKN